MISGWSLTATQCAVPRAIPVRDNSLAILELLLIGRRERTTAGGLAEASKDRLASKKRAS